MADNRHLFAGDLERLRLAALKAFFASSLRSRLEFIGDLPTSLVSNCRCSFFDSIAKLRKYYSPSGFGDNWRRSAWNL
jgi:hypothetical protein